MWSQHTQLTSFLGKWVMTRQHCCEVGPVQLMLPSGTLMQHGRVEGAYLPLSGRCPLAWGWRGHHGCWGEGGREHRKRLLRMELRCFVEPSKASLLFQQNPNSQEQKRTFHTYSVFQMTSCILKIKKLS